MFTKSNIASSIAGACLSLTSSSSVVAAEPLDERMILLMPDAVLTFDANTIEIAGDMRTVRMHVYLPAPDEDGYVNYKAKAEIDCAKHVIRSSETIGQKPGGKTESARGQEGFQPIEKKSPMSVLQDQMCAIKEGKKQFAGGIMLEVPGPLAAKAGFGLLKLGLEAKPATELASRDYQDPDDLRFWLDRQKVAASKRAQVVVVLGPLVAEEAKPSPPIVPLAAAVESGRIGQYVHSEHELIARIWLKADGTFQYGLSVGSLDETARGQWSANGTEIALSQGDIPPQRGDIDFSEWRVASDGERLTIIRDGFPVVFERRGGPRKKK